jgi:hypothetical protein
MEDGVSDNEALTERIGQLERARQIDSQITERVPSRQQNGDKYARREYLFLLVGICGFLFSVVFGLIINNGVATRDLERRHDRELSIIAGKHADDRRKVSNWMSFTGFFLVSECKTMRGLAMSMQPGVEVPECMEPSSFPPLD